MCMRVTQITDLFDAGNRSTATANVATTSEVVGSFQEVGLLPESTCNTINRRKTIYSRTGLAEVLNIHTYTTKVRNRNKN